MPKILMVIERYLPIWGGAENQLRQLAPLLVEHEQGVEIVTRRWKKSMQRVESVDGITVRRIGSSGEGLVASLVFVLALLAYLLRTKSEYQVVHSHGAANMGALIALAGMFTGVPTVAKIATAGRIPRLEKGIAGKSVLAFFKRIDAIVCMSRQIDAELQQIGIPGERIRHIENGVDTVRFKPLGEDSRANWRLSRGLSGKTVLVVFSGRLVTRKGVDTLVDAWKIVEEAGTEAHLFLLGSGADQPDSVEHDLKKKIEQSGLHRLHVEGDVPVPEDYLNVADIFAFPSRREGFPNALLEAMAAGLAVVASRIGGNEDLVADGSNGLLFEVDHADALAGHLVALIRDTEQRTRMGEQARSHVLQHNSIALIASRYSALYRELCGESNAR